MNEPNKHLGQSGSYAVYTDKFDPTLLVSIPRSSARSDWDIIGNEFVGADVWHCHESTFLTNRGLPVAGTLKIIYSSDSKSIVESKSIKLYCNSFDMCKMGETVKEATENYVKQVTNDLSILLETEVKVHFFPIGSDLGNLVVNSPGGGYKNLTELPLIEEIEFNDFSASENHLNFKYLEGIRDCRFKTNVLRSRCRFTKQKDTGEAFFYIKTKDTVLDAYSLLKQVISLREVNEFHEFCAEKLFVDLIREQSVVECCVMLFYSRRGSLDINPVRATSMNLVPLVMQQAEIYTKKQMGQ